MTRLSHRRFSACRVLAVCSLTLAAGLCACTQSTQGSSSGDPLADVRDAKEDVRTRVAAVEPARSKASANPALLGATVQTFKDIAWTPKEDPSLRVAVITSLLNDPDPAIVDNARAMGTLMLPREQDRAVVVLYAQTAADRGWTDYIPPLIRSFSRPLAAVEDQERSEALALRTLSGGKPVEEVVFGVFLNPPSLPQSYGLDWAERFRADAWDLLGRLDRDGQMRVRMLTDAPAGSQGDAVVSNMRRALSDLRAIPLTGAELTWLGSLADPTKAANAAWWQQASSAIGGVTDNGPFYLRHAEPVRWAAANKPVWYNASREQLLSELSTRLAERDRVERATGFAVKVRENLAHYAPRLKWADVLSMLVLDELLASPSVRTALFEQTRLDRNDKTTEYGGLLTFGGEQAGSGRAALYPPRPGQRNGDQKFVASDAMIAASDLALAHYHFHVQETLNGKYAGPSDGDLVYAARYGRSCVVFTSLNEDELNADFYQPDGVVIDLGTIKRAK
ncbi:MAG: hypothetical protein ACOYN0_05745 [Phycisphaerales bacterium]